MVKVKKPKKRLPPSKSSLVKKLDHEISLYIRLSNSDTNGYVRCVTCSAFKHWKEMQAGHYISRSHYSTRWNEDNIFPQCVSCNVFKNGNYPVYAEYLDEKFGVDYKKKLRLLGAVTVQVSRQWLEEQIKQYKQLNLKFKHLK